MGTQPLQRKGRSSSLALTCTDLWPSAGCRACPELQDMFSPTVQRKSELVDRIGEKGLVQSLAETWHSPERGTDLSVAHLPQGVCASEAFCPSDTKPCSSRASRRVFPTLSQLQSLMPLCPREERRGWEVLPTAQAGLLLPHWQKKLVSFS